MLQKIQSPEWGEPDRVGDTDAAVEGGELHHVPLHAIIPRCQTGTHTTQEQSTQESYERHMPYESRKLRIILNMIQQIKSE